MIAFPRWPGWSGRLFAVGAAALFVALAMRASDPDRWSDWSFGEAQTVLTMRHWQEGGWLANRLLLVPQGYARPIHHVDDPDLRQHAHGISRGSSPRVGPRFRYTHYPSGYLIPYALLAEAGLGTMFAWRLLSLAISFAALTLMYLVFARLASAPVALVASLFYALSPAFLGFADAIANQPIDDLLRFGFMLAVVLSTRAAEPRARRRALIAAWGTEFLLSLCSFDSVFFVFVWLVGWDLLEGRGFAWKKYLAFAAAPVAGFGLFFLQTAWYLGWTDAVVDLTDTFLQRSPIAVSEWNVGSGVLMSIGNALIMVVEFVYPQPFLALAAALGYLLWHRRQGHAGAGVPPPRLLGLLFLCGAAFEVVLPQTAWMLYEGRQMAPVLSLLAGGSTVAAIHAVRAALQRLPPDVGMSRGLVRPLALGAAITVLVGFWFTWGESLHRHLGRPSYLAIPKEDLSVLIAKDLRHLATAHDPVFFDLGGFSNYMVSADDTRGYRTIPQILEVYLGSRPVLAFTDANGLVEDLLKLATRAPRQFSPVLVARDESALRAVVADLGRRGWLARLPDAPRPVRDAFFLDLTPAMNWR